jgi:hypothetical protein
LRGFVLRGVFPTLLRDTERLAVTALLFSVFPFWPVVVFTRIDGLRGARVLASADVRCFILAVAVAERAG